MVLSYQTSVFLMPVRREITMEVNQRMSNIFKVVCIVLLQVDEYGQLKKFSSCSTIFIDDSTVSQPNLKNTIKTVALAIYFHIRNRDRFTGRNNHLDRHILDIFDEKLHPLAVRLLVISSSV